MVTRPIFVPNPGSGPLVKRIEVPLKWHGGFALVQSRKNIAALHAGAEREGIYPMLEISSKSEQQLGVSLSAFNLQLRHPKIGRLPVEAAFQGSKVFEHGGPFREFYNLQGREIKKDPRLKESGALIHFDLAGQRWPLKPVTGFYDWVYLKALRQNSDLHEPILDYAGFTDIAFNPNKSLNCQARSVALFVELHNRGLLDDALENPEAFLEILRQAERPKPLGVQETDTLLLKTGQAQATKPKHGKKPKKSSSEDVQYELFAEAA